MANFARLRLVGRNRDNVDTEPRADTPAFGECIGAGTAVPYGKPAQRTEAGCGRGRGRSNLGYAPLVCLFLIFGGFAACDADPVRVEEPAGVLSVSIAPTAQPLTRAVRVVLERPAPVEITYRSDEESPLRVTAESSEQVHELLLPRLRAGRGYRFAARSLPAGNVVTGIFETEPLPEPLAALSFRTEGTPTHPLIALEVQHTVGFGGLVIVDHAGEIVWYEEVPGGVLGATQRANGNIALIARGSDVREYTAAGQLVARLPNTGDRVAHHDLLEHEGRLLVLTTDDRELDGAVIGGEAVWSWNSRTGDLERIWSAWDHLDPAVDWGELSRPGDWLHANSLSIGPRGNLLISLRSLDQVLSVDLASNALEWRFGGVNATIPVAGVEKFRGQHTAAEIAPHRVLMFDNRWDRPDEQSSRAVIFDLDPIAGTAVKSWEFRADPPNWARAMSLARELEGGHVFVHFGGTGGRIETYEVRSDGEIVWRMDTEGIPSLYRAWPLASIGGEAALGPAEASTNRS